MNQNETVASLQEENRCRFQKVVFFLYKYQKPNRRKQFSRYWKEILRDISLSARCWYVDWRYFRYLHYKRIVYISSPGEHFWKEALDRVTRNKWLPMQTLRAINTYHPPQRYLPPHDDNSMTSTILYSHW